MEGGPRSHTLVGRGCATVAYRDGPGEVGTEVGLLPDHGVADGRELNENDPTRAAHVVPERGRVGSESCDRARVIVEGPVCFLDDNGVGLGGGGLVGDVNGGLVADLGSRDVEGGEPPAGVGGKAGFDEGDGVAGNGGCD